MPPIRPLGLLDKTTKIKLTKISQFHIRIANVFIGCTLIYRFYDNTIKFEMLTVRDADRSMTDSICLLWWQFVKNMHLGLRKKALKKAEEKKK
jgi:hypothetical protein